MTILLRFLSLLLVVALAACGGGSGTGSAFGGDAGTGTGGGSGGGTPTPSASDLVLTLSANSLANNGTETVVATALAIDANHNTVAGVPVTISVDSGVATASGAVTGADGAVTATIGIGSDHSNRTINVTATSGSITKTAQITVVDSAGGGGAGPSDLLVQFDAPTIANDGSQPVTATITALDAKRNVMPGVVVSVGTDDASATIQPSGTTTGANGVLTAVIGVGNNHANRTITITASSAGLTRTATLPVVNASTPPNPTAADLSLALSSSTLNNGGTSTITATATAVDSRRNALPGIPVTFTVDNNAVATVSGPTTDANGVVTAQIGIGADRANRVVTVTATSGALTKSASFSVVGAKLTASLSPSVNSESAGNRVEYKLVDTNALPMANQPISITSPTLASVSGVTDANGKFVYTYSAPKCDSGCTLSLVASAGGDTLTQNISVAAAGGSTVPELDVQTIKSASLTPTPSVISVNASGDTTNQVELRALFLGDNNQPIPNVRVRFDVADNTNSTDGKASQVGVYAYSDATGVARGTFTPGVNASPTNGITVRACYAGFDFDTSPSACPSADQASARAIKAVTNTLTVTSEALSVNIRTDNTVDPTGAGGLTYIKKFVVMVVDAAGQAKPDVLITPSVDLPGYYKGFYSWNGTVWAQNPTLASTENYTYDAPGKPQQWSKSGSTTQPQCPNEDVNRNGVREAPVYSPTAAAADPNRLDLRQEDLNWNGDLDPRKADVAIKMVGSARTDSNGLAIVQIEYGKNLASWVDFVITVTASGISGTEARARFSGLLYGVGNLPFLAADVTDQKVPPAFVVSPYGRGTVCTDTN